MMLPIVVGVVSISMALATGWLVLQLRLSQERIISRIDALSIRSSVTPVPGAVSQPARTGTAFALPALDGRIVSLQDLLARGKRILINFTDPKCGPCYEHLADVGGWERAYGDRLTIVTISSGDVRLNSAMAQEYGLGMVLLQHAHDVADSYGMQMLPAAILIEPDGRIADSVTGAHQVRQLVATALGLEVPPHQVREMKPLVPGQLVGSLRRPDLDGNMIDLGEQRREPSLLLFWSPGCSHCQDLLSAMRGWSDTAQGMRLVVVTSGPAGLNREAGIQAPMIQDDAGVLKSTFGVQGTPAALVIDGDGRVASGIARGATAVRPLLAQRVASSAAA